MIHYSISFQKRIHVRIINICHNDKKGCNVKLDEREWTQCQYINDGCVPNVKSFVILQIWQPIKICRVTSLLWLMTKTCILIKRCHCSSIKAALNLNLKTETIFLIIKKKPTNYCFFCKHQRNHLTMKILALRKKLWVKSLKSTCYSLIICCTCVSLQFEMLIKHRRWTCINTSDFLKYGYYYK